MRAEEIKMKIYVVTSNSFDPDAWKQPSGTIRIEGVYFDKLAARERMDAIEHLTEPKLFEYDANEVGVECSDLVFAL